MRPAIVVIAYNRIEPMKRLLKSVEAAEYPFATDVNLVISIDRAKDGSNEDVVKAANDFVWSHGEKQIIYREENYGLKRHVLTCGDLSETYGSVILLEDDLYVSPSFYRFALEALTFVSEDNRIGGVSLYNHRFNVHVREPFEAIDDCSDNWYFQFASSWGQAFTAGQWRSFKAWLEENDGRNLAAPDMPKNVSGWSDKSWLKYYIKYLIETDRYFLYPMISYTTNFAEEGTHASETVNDLQVPIAGVWPLTKSFNFRNLSDARNVYDAFFENVILKNKVNEYIKKDGKTDNMAAEIIIDLYGYKDINHKAGYLLSSRSLPYKRIKSFARSLRPIDANIFEDMCGEEFFLYDLCEPSSAPKVNKTAKLFYNYRAIKTKEMIRLIWQIIMKKL